MYMYSSDGTQRHWTAITRIQPVKKGDHDAMSGQATIILCVE
jgi:hypothetical protein